jgi:hypothetical protein
VDVVVVGIGGGFLLVLIIVAPNSFHTHIKSSLYMYNAVQHLLQRLQVIMMQPQPDICSMEPESENGFSVGSNN